MITVCQKDYKHRVISTRKVDLNANQEDFRNANSRPFFEPKSVRAQKHSSTVTALIQVLDSLKLAVDQKQYSVATFIHLGKAFDIIDRRILLARLTKFGFGN